MIDVALRDNLPILALFAALALLSGPLAWRLARSRSLPVPAAVGTSTSAALVLAATLYRLHPGAPATRTCTLQQDLVGSVLAPQGLLNTALFVPLSFFLTVLARRPMPVLAATVVLSGAIEIAQALAPGMGRACDSADLAANGLGALAGCLAGRAWIRAAARRTGPSAPRPNARRRDVRLASGIAGAGALVLLVAALPTLLVTVSDTSDAHGADPAQRKAAAAAVREYFGDSAVPTKVQYTRGSHGQSGRVEVAARSGQLVLDWPSREVRSGQLSATAPDRPGTAPLAEADARSAAADFAKAHFTWAPSGEGTQVTAAGGPDSQAKLVSWRSRVDGVLMPMRLDVIVGGDRRILAFSANGTPPPPGLPKPAVTREQAHTRALAAHPGTEVTSSDLVAKQDRQGAWRVCWMISLATPGQPAAAPPAGGASHPRGMLAVILDAETGAPFQNGELTFAG
ncbi:VanZ family protein [Streptomyces polychromogenes]|nr:VanZ family protein [Streptomyces polychromogenes]